MIRVLLALALSVAGLVAGAAVAHARSPLVGQLNVVATRYHEDPARLDALREGLEQAVRDDADAGNFTALSRVSFTWGDVRAKSDDEKLAAYERGRESGRRAIEPEPKSFLGHLWYAINAARWGQTKGVVRSLVLLPTVREEIRVRAEATFRKGPQLDPKNQPAEARRELSAVLGEKDPSNLADWTVKDVPDARRLLESIRDR